MASTPVSKGARVLEGVVPMTPPRLTLGAVKDKKDVSSKDKKDERDVSNKDKKDMSSKDKKDISNEKKREILQTVDFQV